jgi:anti-anti-sigma regulatory factor
VNPYERDYAELLSLLGRAAAPSDGTPDSEIDAAENDIGMRMPTSLRAFYLVAGRATDLTEAHDRFLAPRAWHVESGVVVFMEENQAVTLCGVSTDLDASDDPPALATWNDHDLDWFEVCGRASEFIKVMLCWAAAHGALFGFRRKMRASRDLAERLDPQWTLVGRIGVSDTHAYIQQGRVLCVWEDLGVWQLVVAARSSHEVDSIVADLQGRILDDAGDRPRPAHVGVLSLVGELRAGSPAAGLVRARLDASELEESSLVLDLGALHALDEHGVQLLVALQQRARRANGEVKLAKLQGQPAQLVRLLRLGSVFDCCDSVEAAFSRFGDGL